MRRDDQVVHPGTLQFNGLAGLDAEGQRQCLIGEEAGWDTHLDRVLLVRARPKAKVGALLDSVSDPGDARFNASQGVAQAARVHLSQVKGHAHDVQEELVPCRCRPVINLVQGELNCHPICFHWVWPGTEGDADGL